MAEKSRVEIGEETLHGNGRVLLLREMPQAHTATQGGSSQCMRQRQWWVHQKTYGAL